MHTVLLIFVFVIQRQVFHVASYGIRSLLIVAEKGEGEGSCGVRK